MASTVDEIISYPIVSEAGLAVDPIYRELQQQGPIRVRLPEGEPCWLATRYEDVRNIYAGRGFSRAAGFGRDAPRVWPGALVTDPSVLLQMDPPDHTRIRRLASGAFSPQRIRALRGWIKELADGLLDDMCAHGGPADFVSMFAANLPIAVISGILGVAKEDSGQFRGWVETTVAMDATPAERAQAQMRMETHISRLIAERRLRRTDDLLSVLVDARDDQDRLTEDELLGLCKSLMLGGFETTLMQLGATVFTLLTHPRHWQELRSDPTLMPAALEELWRWIPSFKYGVPFVRWATQDVELSGGTLIRAGEPVLPEHAVANRDESVFPRGWELDFHRVNPRPHLSLGFGPHFCLGSHLAHLQIEVSVEALLQRFPDLQLAVAPEDVVWSPSTFMRSVEKLPLTW